MAASQSRRQAASVSASRGLDSLATCSYTVAMKVVSIREAKNRLTELAREVERGETILVTRNGSPILEFTPHRPRKGLRLGAIDEFKRKHRVEKIVTFIADDFDDPLPEDFLLRPSA
jgi:prevent-host-death family protein